MEWLSNLTDTAAQLAEAGSNVYAKTVGNAGAAAKTTKATATKTNYLPWIIGGGAALLLGGLLLILALRK